MSMASPPTPTMTWFLTMSGRGGGEVLLTCVGEVLAP